MSMNIQEKVKSIIIKQLAVEDAKVVDSALFMDDLGADSLDMVELVMSMEDAFNLKIQDETAQKLRTVGDVIQYITAHTPGSIH
jgi:acyl carrier protein